MNYPKYSYQANQKLKAIKSCFLCGSDNKVETHHLDCNHKNNEPFNRIRLCQSCHVAIHRYYGKIDMKEIHKIKKLGTMKYLK
jgi:5-methylcytosine-specific restriction endonuclease McrA